MVKEAEEGTGSNVGEHRDGVGGEGLEERKREGVEDSR